MPQFNEVKKSELNDEAVAYDIIFRSLLQGVNVEIRGDYLYLESSDGLIKKKLETLLSRPEILRGKVGKFVFIPGSNDPFDSNNLLNSGSLNHPLIPRSKMPELPVNFLHSLFAEEILNEVNLNAIDTAQLSEVEGNIIYSIPNYAKTARLWDERINILRDVLQRAGTKGLSRVFLEKEPLSLDVEGVIDPEISKHVQDIIGIKFDPKLSDTACFYLNQRYLTDLVVLPELTLVPETGAIKINKDQLATYLGRVFGDIIIPNQDLRQSVDKSFSLVTPIIVPKVVVNPINKQNIYEFLIDTSGSLAYVEYSYKKSLINILEKLVAKIKVSSTEYVNANDIIRLVYFNTDFRYVDFRVIDALDSLDELKHSINSMVITGTTKLDGTIARQIKDLPKLCANREDCNVNMFILTDGEDNASSREEISLLNLQGDEFRAQKTDFTPRFYIIRVGRSDVSHIDAISRGLDAQTYNIEDVDKLSSFLQNVADLNLHRAIIKFEQENREITLPVYDNRIALGPDINIQSPVKIKDIEYNIVESTSYIDNLTYGNSIVTCSYPSGDTIFLLPHPLKALKYADNKDSLLKDLPLVVDIKQNTCEWKTWQGNSALMCQTANEIDIVINPARPDNIYQVTMDTNLALCFVLKRIAKNAVKSLCSSLKLDAEGCANNQAYLEQNSALVCKHNMN